jgi:hypothetical protein
LTAEARSELINLIPEQTGLSVDVRDNSFQLAVQQIRLTIETPDVFEAPVHQMRLVVEAYNDFFESPV